MPSGISPRLSSGSMDLPSPAAAAFAALPPRRKAIVVDDGDDEQNEHDHCRRDDNAKDDFPDINIDDIDLLLLRVR